MCRRAKYWCSLHNAAAKINFPDLLNHSDLKYNRILLKLSGEALMGQQQYGIDAERLMQYASEIQAVAATGIQVAVVIGGGNIYRGVEAEAFGLDRVQGDYM